MCDTSHSEQEEKMRDWKVMKYDGITALGHRHPECENEDKEVGRSDPGWKEAVRYSEEKWVCFICEAEAPPLVVFCAELANCDGFPSYVQWRKKDTWILPTEKP